MQVLTVKDVSKKIKSKPILTEISFRIKTGEIVGLIGGNGAGKTTLMKTIIGLTSYQSGEIITGSFNENGDVVNIGALIEAPGIYPYLSGYDNLKLFNESKGNDDINNIISKLKMNEYIQKKAKTYSLGMKQKLGIAMALLNNPKLIILDEPMNGLDPRAVKDVRDVLISLSQKGVAILISSHIISELIKITDSLLIIDKGQIIKRTTMDEINQKGEDIETILLDIIDGKDGIK
ncbi:ABC transporter ATP-binding protein [Staphylococcus cornubiensis]|uniref:ABC transporter ATP-binding protein n=1 Tax=Staphylococcus cornubiensis TaxID=1986155 RepID=UPI000A380CBE|nr:ATP-binding cassette domain-containing protein [Staphylococcus cornubiensis]